MTNALADDHVVDLRLTMNGFRNDKGVVRIAITNTREAFEAQKDDPLPFRKVSTTIHNGKASLVIESLPKGEYAIKVFHDENNNNNLDLNSLGIPKEEYGFSNNVRVRFGPPEYEEARFQLKAAGQEIRILIQTPGSARK